MTPDVVRVKPLPDFYLEADFATGERRSESPPTPLFQRGETEL
jgi:hypothetical protein